DSSRGWIVFFNFEGASLLIKLLQRHANMEPFELAATQIYCRLLAAFLKVEFREFNWVSPPEIVHCLLHFRGKFQTDPKQNALYLRHHRRDGRQAGINVG